MTRCLLRDGGTKFPLKFLVDQHEERRLYYEIELQLFAKFDMKALWDLLGVFHKQLFSVCLVKRGCGSHLDPYHEFKGDHIQFLMGSSHSAFFNHQYVTVQSLTDSDFKPTKEYFTATPKGYFLYVWELMKGDKLRLRQEHPEWPDDKIDDEIVKQK